MPKLVEFDNYRAPWETEAGGDTEIDKSKLKKYLYGLLSDKEKLQGQVTTVTEERDTLKTAADAEARKGESEVDRLKRENEELKNRKPQGDPVEVLRLQVALDKGLTKVQAKRLLGTTEEEIAKDADELLESFGGKGNAPADEEGDEDDDEGVRRQPRQSRNSGVGDDDGNGSKPVDIEAALATIPRI